MGSADPCCCWPPYDACTPPQSKVASEPVAIWASKGFSWLLAAAETKCCRRGEHLRFGTAFGNPAPGNLPTLPASPEDSRAFCKLPVVPVSPRRLEAAPTRQAVDIAMAAAAQSCLWMSFSNHGSAG